MAASAICWMRWRWLAKLAVMIRRSRCSANSDAQHAADAALARRVAGLLGVRRVGEQHADALGAGELADAGEIGAPVVDGREVELEVAGVEDRRPGGVCTAMAWAWGTLWVTGMNSTSNGPIRTPLAVGDGVQLGAPEQPGLLDAVAGEPERERRAVDRHADLAQQELDAADVVLVAVGGDDGVDARRRSRAGT